MTTNAASCVSIHRYLCGYSAANGQMVFKQTIYESASELRDMLNRPDGNEMLETYTLNADEKTHFAARYGIVFFDYINYVLSCDLHD